MDNITVINDYQQNNIQGISVKKIKLNQGQLKEISAKGVLRKPEVTISKVEVERPSFKVELEPLVQEVIKPTVEQKVEEPVNQDFYNGNMNPTYNLNDVASQSAKKVEERYRREEPKVESKIEEEKPSRITEKEFRKLLETEISNSEMKEEKSKYSKIFNQLTDKINDLKSKQAKLADAFQKTSSEEQVCKSNNELLERRTLEMRKKDNFGYLEVSQHEDPRIIEIMENLNTGLTDLLNMNLKVYNENKEKIDKFVNDKVILEKESAKIRKEIQSQTEELSVFMNDSAPLIYELIEANNIFNKSKVASQKVIKNGYNEINKTEDLEEVTKTINNVPRINFGSQPAKTEPVTNNVFDGLRKQTPEEVVDINFVSSARQPVTSIHSSSDMQNESMSYFGRVA